MAISINEELIYRGGNARFEMRSSDEFKDVLDEGASLAGEELSVFVRRAVLAATARLKAGLPVVGDVPNATNGKKDFHAPYIHTIPNSESWKDRFEWVKKHDETRTVELVWGRTINQQIADELEARDGDFWLRATNQDLEAVGILDNFLVLMRPYGKGVWPRRGDIVAITINDHDKKKLANTIKIWGEPKSNGWPEVLNGDGTTYELPPGTLQPKAFARAVGVIGRL